jgi:hypothetical protein
MSSSQGKSVSGLLQLQLLSFFSQLIITTKKKRSTLSFFNGLGFNSNGYRKNHAIFDFFLFKPGVIKFPVMDRS